MKGRVAPRSRGAAWLAAMLTHSVMLAGVAAWLLALPAQAAAGGSAPSADRERQRHVLLLYTESRLLPALVAADRTLRATLEAGSPDRIFFHTEFLDTSLFLDGVPPDEIRQLLRSRFRQKYPPGRLDLVVAGGGRALRIALDHRSELFPDVPLVFVGGEQADFVDLRSDADVTGVWAAIPWAETLDLALRLQPQTRRVVIVTGTSPPDRLWLQQARPAGSLCEPRRDHVPHRSVARGGSPQGVRAGRGDHPPPRRVPA